ncbi:MAG: carbohydrate binding domain-containing protein [Treponema sp.]
MKNTKVLMTAVIAMAVLSAGYSAGAAKSSIYTEYTDDDLVWMDDFDGKTLNDKNWNYEIHEPGWVNNELQSYEASSKNAYVKDGNLIIQAVKSGSKYTSGRINTAGKHEFKYGRFEARLKVPKGKGFLPAFWMMPADESFYGQWPKCGEIDIMEVLGNQTDKLYGTLHFGEPHTQKQGSYKLPQGNFSDEFHVFAVEWEPGEMRFYVDDIMYYKVNDWFTKKDGFGEVSFPAPYDQSFYLILNVAVGGDWPGNPDSTTQFKENAQMVVDYVKVYQKKSYDENVKKPEQVKSRVVPKTGNIVSNKGKDWTLHLEPDGKARAEFSDTELAVYTQKAGTKDYSVQILQSAVQLVQGETYKYSFDAYSEKPRTIKTALTLPDNNWKRAFGDVRVALETAKKNYSYTFTMNDSTDTNARIEFQLGNAGSSAAVHISNVRLERINSSVAKPRRTALPDGNFIYNGEFQEGAGRLEFWEVSDRAGGKVFVSNQNKIRELNADVPSGCKNLDDVRILQKGIELDDGCEYVVRFEARSTKPGKIAVRYGAFYETAQVTEEKKTFVFTFEKAPALSSVCDFEFLLGIAGARVTIDNVSLKQNVLIQNGGFSDGMKAFEVYAHSSAVEEHSAGSDFGDKCFSITIDKTGNVDWTIQLMQRNVELVKGKTYRLTFKASCDVPRKLMVALQRDGIKDDNWEPYSGQQKFNLTSGFKTFEHTFTMQKETDPKTILSFSMGAVDGRQINLRHTIKIDSIELVEVK